MNTYKLQNHRIKLLKLRTFRVYNLASHLVVSIKAISRRNAMLKGKQYFGSTSKVMIIG